MYQFRTMSSQMTVFTCKHWDPENCPAMDIQKKPLKKRRGDMVKQLQSMEVKKNMAKENMSIITILKSKTSRCFYFCAYSLDNFSSSFLWNQGFPTLPWSRSWVYYLVCTTSQWEESELLSKTGVKWTLISFCCYSCPHLSLNLPSTLIGISLRWSLVKS